MTARFILRAASALMAVMAAGAALSAQAPSRALSIDTIFNPATRVDYAGTPATNLTWLDADTYLQTRRTERCV